ncbi:hypothetical protein FDP41_002831 [Naegleria fowleri]|uniref:ADP-ribosylation factor-like protein 6 n=1 Tax=Naegleria fowleri TaxID=5763 RepID=A0A6A5BT09_NAEFO|nr:uncharacterized protein FDP41_002831 [Naegleria fowleri]KAF0978316.1 hypothetical protein FDP41_002831 [Naegleria fowleri]
MGGFSSKKKESVKIVCCGLDNSGKSTIINYLKPKKERESNVVPTIGYSQESFDFDKLNFTVFDMSGQGKYRNLWESFYGEVDGVIFVIDSADRVRIAVAEDEMKILLKEIKDRPIPILFFANKQDLANSLSASEVSESLKLHEIQNKSWTIIASNALVGDGISDGVKWLSEEIRKKLSK